MQLEVSPIFKSSANFSDGCTSLFVRTIFSTASITVIYLMSGICHSIKSMARMCKTCSWELMRKLHLFLGSQDKA